jgi:hypothetical protein
MLISSSAAAVSAICLLMYIVSAFVPADGGAQLGQSQSLVLLVISGLAPATLFAAAFVETFGDRAKLHNFVNSILAEPWQDTAENAEAAGLEAPAVDLGEPLRGVYPEDLHTIAVRPRVPLRRELGNDKPGDVHVPLRITMGSSASISPDR